MTLLTLPLLALAPQPIVAPQDPVELLGIYVNEATAILRHPKDRGLANALALLDERIAELPNEIPDFQMPPGALPLMTRLVMGKKSLRIVRDDQGGMPVAFDLVMHEANPEEAAALGRTLYSLLESMGAPLQPSATAGMTDIPDGPLPVMFGASGADVKLVGGNPIPGRMNLSVATLPGGMAPDMVMHFDYSGFVELMMMFMSAQAPAEAAEFQKLADSFGLDAMDMHMATGSDENRSYTALVMPGWAAEQRRTGLLPTTSVDASILKLVPADASWASVSAINIKGTFDLMLMTMMADLEEQGVEDPIETFAQMTGINLETDLIDHLGSRLGIYASDTTGGGGFASATMFVEIESKDGIESLLTRLAGMIDGVGQTEAKGYVNVRPWTRDGVSYWTLAFPGLPIPLEPTIALTEQFLFIGATQNAALGAVAQMSSPGGGLQENAAFREQLPGSLDGATGVTFLDNARLMRDGYGPMVLMCSALSNAVRSPQDPTRDAGPIMPAYHDFVKNVKANVSISRIQGDDFLQMAHGDPSMLVNVTGVTGFIASSPLVFLIPLGAMGMVTARQEAAMMEEWGEFEEFELEESIPAEPVDPDKDF